MIENKVYLPQNPPPANELYFVMIEYVEKQIRIFENDKKYRDKILYPLYNDLCNYKKELTYSKEFKKLLGRVQNVAQKIVSPTIIYCCPHQNYKKPCPENFNTQEEAIYHFHHAHGSKCSHKDCDYANIDDRKLERHVKAVHKSILILRCKKCPNKKFKGVDVFDRHLEFIHGVKVWSLHLGSQELDRKFKDGT